MLSSTFWTPLPVPSEAVPQIFAVHPAVQPAELYALLAGKVTVELGAVVSVATSWKFCVTVCPFDTATVCVTSVNPDFAAVSVNDLLLPANCTGSEYAPVAFDVVMYGALQLFESQVTVAPLIAALVEEFVIVPVIVAFPATA